MGVWKLIERTQAERITALEVQVINLSTDLREANTKLDQLLELKNKGMGAFWLVSILMGSAFSVMSTFIWDLFK